MEASIHPNALIAMVATNWNPIHKGRAIYLSACGTKLAAHRTVMSLSVTGSEMTPVRCISLASTSWRVWYPKPKAAITTSVTVNVVERLSGIPNDVSISALRSSSWRSDSQISIDIWRALSWMLEVFPNRWVYVGVRQEMMCSCSSSCSKTLLEGDAMAARGKCW